MHTDYTDSQTVHITHSLGKNAGSDDLRRDVRFSEEVWIHQGKTYSCNINIKDKNRIIGKEDDGWLNDTIIDASMQLIQLQFPEIGGLQSCLSAANNKFKSESKQLIQIMNTDPNGSGVHWFVFSTLGAKSGNVNIYDSSPNPGNPTSAVEKAIAKIVHTDEAMLTLKFMGCDQQTNNRDCGLFSKANATELVFKGDPGTVRYANGEILRFHLIECLENRVISIFPRVGILDPRTQHCLVMKIPVFCTCRMPEDNELYFSCLWCKKWFHTACQGLSHLTRAQVKKSRNIYCIRCSLKSKKNKS